MMNNRACTIFVALVFAIPDAWAASDEEMSECVEGDAECLASLTDESARAKVHLIQKKVEKHRHQVAEKVADQSPMVYPRRTGESSEEKALGALMESLHNQEINAISVDEVLPLAINIMANKTQASKETIIATIRKFDKNSDGKFDIGELPAAVETSASEEELGVGLSQPFPLSSSNVSLIQSNLTGQWVDEWLGSRLTRMYSTPLYFTPRVNLPDVSDEYHCLFQSYLFYSPACNYYYKYFYTNGQLCRCWPDSQGYANLGWTVYSSSVNNHIYYYPGDILFNMR